MNTDSAVNDHAEDPDEDPAEDVAAPSTLGDLQVALELDAPPGPRVATWRDEYVALGDAGAPQVELCVEDLHARQLCYSCGQCADRLVAGEFPWVCVRCEEHA